ncbi:putative dehydrogenase [Lachnospiraceae bacterium PF1-21]|uniref:Gfo/Idh/MocA family oxidoreductase n=1 Tax=Ohessyouella blattaphilus TaxID=2949333 RepID=A0ABT1ENF0_9FIRM|nr:Gfo/Idh/MocA family oxidoreductase [Ohessyouella blattaphilus]MCP1111312.1 Gfo/Idh/MocA family oxidoreductase [Ohessyouella blattaphilus]MCR8564706.1 Gfo/Idh/MocA family oxidoreductase [Ohessyouella blattaphilus]
MKVGILGAGGIARKMADTLNGMSEASSYAIASRSLDKALAFKEEHGFEKAYGSYEELVGDPEVELVYVATPHSRHHEDAILCIENGKPVLVEKSFTANASQARAVLELAKERQVFAAEAIWTRYMPSRRMVQEIIDSGKIGKVISVTANLGYDLKAVPRMHDPALAGGALLDVGIYPMQFAAMYLGVDEIEEVISTCTKSETGVDLTNGIILKYRSGQMAILHSSMLESTEQYGIIYGEKGYLIAKNINNIDCIEVYNSERELLQTLSVPEQISGYEYEVLAAKAAIKSGQIECVEIPHQETLKVMMLMDEIRGQWGLKYPFE